MTPDTIAALINGGAAGLLILVVWKFLDFIGKRDEQWQVFFKELHAGDNEKSDKIADALEKLTELLQDHDGKTDQAIARMDERTKARQAQRVQKT